MWLSLSFSVFKNGLSFSKNSKFFSLREFPEPAFPYYLSGLSGQAKKRKEDGLQK